MSRVNILKQIKVDGRWKLVSVPRDRKGGYDWNSLPEGRYFIEWYERGKRRRQAAHPPARRARQLGRNHFHPTRVERLSIAMMGD